MAGYTVHRSSPETSASSISYPVMIGQRVLGLISRYPRITDEKGFETALESLRGHLNDIAGDSGGSDPEPYVSENDLAFFKELKEAADHRMKSPWKGATPITHEETTPHWLPRLKKSDDRVYDKDKNEVKGYRVGYLNVAQFEAPVFFCSDGKLRMLIKHSHRQRRHHIYFGRTFSGYCRLPDPKLLYPVRTRGTKSGVSYNHGQSNSLKTELNKLTGYTFD